MKMLSQAREKEREREKTLKFFLMENSFPLTTHLSFDTQTLFAPKQSGWFLCLFHFKSIECDFYVFSWFFCSCFVFRIPFNCKLLPLVICLRALNGEQKIRRNKKITTKSKTKQPSAPYNYSNLAPFIHCDCFRAGKDQPEWWTANMKR